MSHDHSHAATGHSHRDTSRLKWTLGLVVVYMAVEVVGGVLSGSLALLADAGHMLSDAASLSLALFAAWIARRPPTPEKTYGYHRAEILAALANGVALVVISLYIFYEAWRRIQDPPEVVGPLMMGVAVGGLLVNGAGLILLHSDGNESLNMRGAWLHVLADAAGSVGAVAAGALVWWRGWYLADPIASVLIGVLVLISSWRLLQDSVGVLMQAAPGHVDVESVRHALVGIDGVVAVHDLHVWTITSGLDSLSAHVVSNGTRPDREILGEARRLIHDRFGIDHCTIQIEPEAFQEPETGV